MACMLAEFARIRAIRGQLDIRSPKSGDFGDVRCVQFVGVDMLITYGDQHERAAWSAAVC